MRKIWILVIACISYAGCTTQVHHDNKSDATRVVTKPQAVEFADSKYAEMGKKMLAALSIGDVTGFLADFADNAVYQWNSGDSIAGKPAISEFWTKLRTDIMDSLTYSNEIWLPVKVNQPQSVENPGVWLLGWYQVYAKYKSGKSMSQWMQIDFHFDVNNKIDRVIQYVDHVPIKAAETR